MKKEEANQKFWRDRLNRWLWGGSAALWFGSVGFLLVRLLPSIKGQPTVPLHYNVHVGIDKLGAWWQIFIPAAVGVIFLLLNLGLAQIFWRRSPKIGQLVGFWSLGLSIILAVANAFLVVINLFYA